jgi:hypothetical protein
MLLVLLESCLLLFKLFELLLFPLFLLLFMLLTVWFPLLWLLMPLPPDLPLPPLAWAEAVRLRAAIVVRTKARLRVVRKAFIVLSLH